MYWQITEWTLISLSTIVIAARIWLRLGLQKQRLLGSDVWMTAAWAMGIITASFCITYVHMGVMEDGIAPDLSNFEASDERKKTILKVTNTRSERHYLAKVDSLTATLDQRSSFHNIFLPVQSSSTLCLSPGYPGVHDQTTDLSLGDCMLCCRLFHRYFCSFIHDLHSRQPLVVSLFTSIF